MTTELIAQLASLPVEIIRALRKTSTTSAPRRVVDAVLSITFHPSRGRDLTPAVGAHRRLRALNAMGYGDGLLAARLGVDIDVEPAVKALGALDAWIDLWRARLKAEGRPDAERQAAMRAVNPKYVLRNWIAESAIRAAQAGDFSETATVLACLSKPFDEQPEFERFAAPPPDWAGSLSVSCSS